MCVSLRNRDPRIRRRVVSGNLLLAAAFILWNFTRRGDSQAQLWLHALHGLLLGLSIGINLSALFLARRCRSYTIRQA